MPAAHFDPPPRTEPCRFLLRHWQSLRGDRIKPRRSEIDPVALVPHLPHIGLFEVHGPEVTLCRLAGTAFRQSLGFELTGRNVVHLYAPPLHRAAGYRFHMMATQPCAAALELPLRFSSGAENPHEIVLLPVEPERDGAAPLLLVAAAAVAALEWRNTAVLPHLDASPSFRFIDIGAGIPASSMPPEVV